jgi:hypothetical protein
VVLELGRLDAAGRAEELPPLGRSDADALRRVWPLVALLVLLAQFLDEQVAFVEVDVGEDGTAHAPPGGCRGRNRGVPPFTDTTS